MNDPSRPLEISFSSDVHKPQHLATTCLLSHVRPRFLLSAPYKRPLHRPCLCSVALSASHMRPPGLLLCSHCPSDLTGNKNVINFLILKKNFKIHFLYETSFFLFCQPIYFFPLFTCLVTKTIVYPFPCYSIIFFLWTLLSHDICSCSTKFFHSPVEWKNPQELEQSLHHFCYSCISSIGLFPLRNRFLIGGFSCRSSLFWSLTSVVREWKAG